MFRLFIAILIVLYFTVHFLAGLCFRKLILASKAKSKEDKKRHLLGSLGYMLLTFIMAVIFIATIFISIGV